MNLKPHILAAFLIIISFIAYPQDLPQVVSGHICRFENFPSRFVDSRNIDVWLPQDYDPKKHYVVIYMHDGQMLFDTSTTWNKSSWDVDDVLTKLTQEKKIKDVIVVAVWNGGKARHSDYFPQKPFESLSAEQKESVYKAARTNGESVFNDYKIRSDNYLKFLVKELKPFIDKEYSTYSDRKHTFIAGSSMGGLISIYGICEYPKIFGGAACLSTHWPGIFTMEGNPVPASFIDYLSKKLPDPKTHKIYFDYGDQTLDALYPPLQKKVDEVMKARGFSESNWETLYFPGMGHSEKSWHDRLHIPMEFLLGK
jgi:predicted alpha/beta superfamily hydrolase